MPRLKKATPPEPVKPTRGPSAVLRAPPGSFAECLYNARNAAGLTQTELAERMGCAQPNVYRWEAGISPVGETTIRRYAAALGMRVSLSLDR